MTRLRVRGASYGPGYIVGYVVEEGAGSFVRFEELEDCGYVILSEGRHSG